MGDIGEWGEFGEGFFCVGDVTLDVFDWVVSVPGGAGAAGHAINLPWAAWGVGEREDLRQAVTDDSSYAYDEGDALKAFGCIVIVEFFLQNKINKVTI